MLTAEQLQEIKERAEKATEGPWEVEGLKYAGEYAVKDKLGWYIAVHHHDVKQDMDFIAHARQDIPALIAEVEYQKANAEQYLKDNVNLHNENLTLNDEVKWLRSESARLRKQLNHTELAEAKARMQAEEMAKVAMDDTYNAFTEQLEIKRLREALERIAYTPAFKSQAEIEVFADKVLRGDSDAI